ncbi:MAG: prephenate dehydratase [Alphaproteobacteria bacterium]|nr:prephenate dehydratase [Alphaproteobacteria bacterium]
MNFSQYKTVAFQGVHGAYSDLAAREMCPDLATIPCLSFDDAFDAIKSGAADLGMIPVDNTLAGRVADVHRLLPESGLHIIGEHFLPIQHALLGTKDSARETVKDVYSHVHAIPQCRKLIKELGLRAHVTGDTAGAAEEIASRNNPQHCAIASKLCAEIYGLKILRENVQDADNNTTRFLLLCPEAKIPAQDKHCITSFIFEVGNIPAALYKVLGGFATNNVQLLRLESYNGGDFKVARFYVDIQGHSEAENVKRAFEEMRFFISHFSLLGCYEASPLRERF